MDQVVDSAIVCSLGKVIEGASIVVLERDEALSSASKRVLETPLQRPIAAKEIAWEAAMKPLIVHAAPGWEEMKRQIEECHLAAHLLLSEVADFGIEAFSNARRNWREAGPFRNFYDLKGAFSKIPAVICGAGGSLLEAAPFLKESGALIFAAGSAFSQLVRLDVDPHAVCALDKQMVPPEIFSKVPLFMQSRLNPEVVSRFCGEKVLVPESGPLSWERWWLETEEEISCGWTVGNFALKIALLLGCDPIILTGMDYCYLDGKKYALDQEKKDLPGTIEARNRLGEPVLTQRDWIMAARFCDEAAKEYRDRRIISTSVRGLFLGDQIEVIPFLRLELPQKKIDIQGLIQKASRISFQDKEKAWTESLMRCGLEEDLSGEPIYETILEPLWRIWRPLFEREAKGQSMELHRKLFFQKVLFFFFNHAVGTSKEVFSI